jgi:hypothetical protein
MTQISSVLTYTCPTCEIAADTKLLKLQRLQNMVFRPTGNIPRCTPTTDMRVAFKIPSVYDFITKLCRQPAEAVRNHYNDNDRSTGQCGAQHTQYGAVTWRR